MIIKNILVFVAIGVSLQLSSCKDNSTSPNTPEKKNYPVVINELMASNELTIKDPQGKYEDWVELYNTSDVAVNLDTCYLSDKIDNPTKWRFPTGTIIEPKGYLMVWCDEDSLDAGLHADFKLAKEGEGVYLFTKEATGNVMLDSTSFGELDKDVSWGRLPNGTGSFKSFTTPTPGGENK